MAAPTFIAAHWYNRPQTLGQCADQLRAFLQALRQHNEQLYGSWFEQAGSKARALAKPLPQEYAAILKSFGTKANEGSYPATSFSVSLWNGARKNEEGIVLRVSLGSCEQKLYPNVCLLELYQNTACRAFYANPDNVQAIKQLFLRFWQPEKLILD
ncbi:Imm52 family immunity protein [Hymenobacter guriensis]|uniref:Immunity protein 52 domain-containing protein n=1 Tax=Hymenobacter guriensis TaxID=2793065 RepID=A0ABS0KXH6_9BACT|nr:Imm52 family immunity protein [Hymenobacter guriensis]MBG8552559.1 hypothetical protein [Hymenobacter guriensis]